MGAGVGQRANRRRPRHAAAFVAALVALFALSAHAQHLLVGSAWVVDAPTKIAATRGWFNEGVPPDAAERIEVVYATSGQEAIAHLLRNQATFALAAPSPVADAVLAQAHAGDRDEDVVVLASVGLSNQTHDVVASRASGIREPSDMVGARLGVLIGSSAHMAWVGFAAAAGIDGATVELVDLTPEAHAEAMQRGEVDAVMTWEPYATRIAEGLGDDAVRFGTRELYSVNWLLLTKRRTAETMPDLVDRVLRAYVRAVAYRHADPAAALRLHADVGNVDIGTLDRLEEHVIWRVELGWSVLANMDGQIRWQAARRGSRLLPVPPDYLHADALRRLHPERIVIPAHLAGSSGSVPSDRSP